MPQEMSNEMLANGGLNLNAISYLSTAKLLNEVLAKGYKVKRILLDQLGPPSKHIFEVKRLCGHLLDHKTLIVSESKADDTYPVVSAASIIAKVSRDNLLEKWCY
jgi:ribonuclease H2 subunit A